MPPTPREVRASCQSRTGPDYSDHFHFAFDENALWHDLQPVLNVHQSSRDPTAETHSQTTLRELLESGGVRNQYNELCEFEKEDQKSIELLLAYSLLCLRGTSWLQACVGVDEIISFPSPDSEDLLSRWRPHLPCTLGEKAQICDEIDQIRAFGILLMELESGLRATSLPELDFEPDYENPRAGPTKDAVLERMLAEWARKVDDGYFRVASACLDFPNRAELMLPFLGEHADKIGDENLEKLKRTAAIFKHVVMPLREILEKRHSNVFQLFNNFSVHTAEHRDEELDFFDDASTDGLVPFPCPRLGMDVLSHSPCILGLNPRTRALQMSGGMQSISLMVLRSASTTFSLKRERLAVRELRSPSSTPASTLTTFSSKTR